MTGTVIALSIKRFGFGEVRADGGQRLRFRRADVAHPEEFESLLRRRVDFDLQRDDKGQPQAVRIRPVK
jgi:hypothetical protein